MPISELLSQNNQRTLIIFKSTTQSSIRNGEARKICASRVNGRGGFCAEGVVVALV
jgi:hypothetical protein